MQTIKRLITSPKFIWIVVIGFILQGLFFAVAVNPSFQDYHEGGYITRGGGVIPDGNRHIGAIYFFAEQPIQNGPFLDGVMEPRDLWMGDLERFPSYMYYYLLSFPVRVAMMLGASDITLVMLIRLIGLIAGVGVVLVFRRIVQTVQKSQVVTNLSTLALAATGSLAWLAPAENYDVLSLLFFMLFILAAVRFVTHKDTTQLGWMAMWMFTVSITKYTYLPFSGLAGLVTLGMVIYGLGGFKAFWVALKSQHAKLYKAKKWLLGLLAVGVLISGALFTERIIGNLVQYQSVSPNCKVIHAHEDCMVFGVYSRNHNRASKMETGEIQPINYKPIEYTELWLDRYYTSMYAYVGHIAIYDFWPVMYVGAIITAIILVGILLYNLIRRRRVLVTSGQKFLAFMVGVLVLAQYIINANSFLKYGGVPYAHQGRYLLPAIGFIYMIMLLATARLWASLDAKRRKIVFWPLTIIVVLSGLANSALVLWFVHADSIHWYSEFIRQIFYY